MFLNSTHKIEEAAICIHVTAVHTNCCNKKKCNETYTIIMTLMSVHYIVILP